MRTRAVHAGAPSPEAGHPLPASPGLEQASAQLFHNLDDLEAAYEGGADIYRPYGSPNPARLEQALLELEGEGVGRELSALVTASGMSAIHIAALAHLTPGRRLLAAADVYGGTHHMFQSELPTLGIAAEVVDIWDPDALRKGLDGASLLLVETISNPAMRVVDIPALAQLTHDAGAALIVDNTFATPILCRPLLHGADGVMHSLTKYVSGHGDAVGGVLVYSRELEPLVQRLATTYRPTASPLDTWLALRGLRTLALRVEAACRNALELAGWLEAHPAITRVHYPGLASHPTHEVAGRMLEAGFGGMLSFELADGAPAVAHLCRRLKLISIMPSLADVATTVSYPIATSHRGHAEAELAAAGVTPGMLRLSAGIEDVEDLVADLDQALAAP